ncbi:hypothetical protein [Mesorhizobium sp.]|uniref:hypothetical protein n=1 Tax=Mesorhizobium sp. TaxID=1871066 RepID=UPI0025C39E3B|nr:hypothetical protein [Mesorhizobium sp.]
MTMISEADIPAIELSEREKAPGRPSRARTIGVVAAGAVLVTAINVTAAFYLYRGVNDLRALEARLDQLGQFEQRIGARIDTVNNGFQSRFETLDRQLQASFGQINGNLARLAPARRRRCRNPAGARAQFRQHDRGRGLGR